MKKSIVSAMYSEHPRFFLESNGDQLKNKPNGRPLFHNLVRRNDNKGKGERSGFSQTYFAIEYCNQSKSLSNVEALTMGKFGKELIESANEAIAMSDSYEMSNYYRLTATVFWESAKVLNADFVAKGKPFSGNIFSVPFYHLVSHAAELLLKCAILKRNGSVKSLKKLPVRHSLSLLLKELQKSNIPITEKTVSLIDALTQQHEKHILRYDVFHPDNEVPVYTPEPEDLFEMLTELLMAGRISTYGR